MTNQSHTNTLGIRDRELDGLFASMDSGSSSAAAKAGRVFSRWQFRQRSLAVRILQPGGSEMTTRMACRNLSKGGIGLLHRAYVHIGTNCEVTIPHPTKGDQDYAGKVVRCLHFSGMVHEIGIAFENDIPIREITCPDPMREIFAIEHVDADSLTGTILLVEDSEMDVKLVKHFLRGTQIRVKHAATIDEADREVREGVGLVLCDIHLGEENGADFARKLNDTMANRPPIVMISADRAASTHALISKPYIKGFLAKPFSQDALLRTISEFMADPNEGDPVADTGSVAGDAQLVAALLPELTKACGRLEEAVKAEDETLSLSLLMQISGVAPVMGLKELSVMVESLSQQLADSMDLQRVASRLEDIVRLCDEATKRG